ncbi:MAG: acyl-CoA dehydrogenase family protein [Actinobacteria bacterium]|nr:acyl-CoA dehydrogenase family protein [Actinomycetota bacterium]
MERTIFDEEHAQFRAMVREFIAKEVSPHHDVWEKDGIVPRELWVKAGAQGLLCTDVDTAYGGGGVRDFRYNVIVDEEIARAGASGVGFGLHNDVIVPYIDKFADDEQKARWFPPMASGEKITAIAMTEPGTGSDLAAVRTTAVRQDDGSFLVNGSKTFITNGINADLVIVVATTDPDSRHAGISLLMVEQGMDGFTRGRNLDKMGLKAQDTAELFFDDVRVPAENLIGEEGQGFVYLMQALPQERLSIAVGAMAGAEGALDLTLEYCREREAFGRPIGKFQNTRFELAKMKTEVTVGRQFVDRCISLHDEGRLTVEQAAMAKYWTTEMLDRVVDVGVQLHGGYGYMMEYPIARAYVDSRVQRIYGGTNEIMLEIIGRSMGF